MILLLLINVVCICVGVGVAALASFPLYLGLLVGWLCPSVVLMLVMLPYIVRDKMHHRRNPPSFVPWHKQGELRA